MLAMTTLFSISACDTETEMGGDLSGLTHVTLVDFEQYVPDIDLIHMDRSFGRITLNTDEQYVASGKSSAKVQPLGSYVSKSTPIFILPLSSEKYEYDYTDGRFLSSVTLSVYSEQAKESNLKIGLSVRENNPAFSGTGFTTITSQSRYVLKQGWNEIIYYPDMASLNIAFDATNVLGVAFTFENSGTRELAECPVYYFDNVQLHRHEEAQEIKDVIDLDENEILGFEKEWQSMAFYTLCNDVLRMPDASIVEASTEGITATQGSKVLKYVHKPTAKSWDGSWLTLRIPAKVMQASGFMNMSDQEVGNYRISFDFCYKKAPTNGGTPAFYVEMYSEDGSERKVYTDDGECKFKEEWSTVSIRLALCRSAVWKTPGELRIFCSDFPLEWGPVTTYFDNFRIERIPTEGDAQ